MSKISPFLLLLLLLLIQVCCWLILQPVFPFDDAYIYAYKAFQINEGFFEISRHYFGHRFGVFLPASLIFRVFGINAYSIALWPLLCNLLMISLLFSMMKKNISVEIAFLSALLLATNFLQSTYASTLFPDLIMSCWAFLSIYCLYKGRQKNSMSDAFAFVLFFMAGLLTKTMIVLILPFVFSCLLYDLYNKRHLAFWKAAVPGFALAIFLFLLAYYLITGEWLYRYQMIAQHYNETFQLSGKALLKRLTYEPFIWLLSMPSYLLLLGFSLPFSVYTLFKKQPAFALFWSVYLLMLLGVYCWGSSSFSTYTPILLYDRMWLLLLLPLCVLTALSLPHLQEPVKKKVQLKHVIASLFLLFALYHHNTLSQLLLYAGIGFLVMISDKTKSLKFSFPAYLIVFSGIYFLLRNSNHLLPSARDQKAEADIILSLDKEEEKVLLIDEERAENYIIYNGFKPLKKVEVLPWRCDLSDITKPTYFLINQSRKEFLAAYKKELIPNCMEDLQGWDLVEKREGVSLFLKHD